MTVSNKNIQSGGTIYTYVSTGKEVELEKSEGEKDIGVLVDDQLTISRIFNSRRTVLWAS